MQGNQQPIKEYLNSDVWYPEKVHRLSRKGVPDEALAKGKRSIFRNEDNDIVRLIRKLIRLKDEVDYWLYPQEIKQMVPVIEKLWLEPRQRVFPHVKLKCETSLSLYWDKGGVEFPDVEWNDDGTPKLEVPEFVKQVHQKEKENEQI